MEDKRVEEKWTSKAMQELSFTKEERQKVFERIHHLDGSDKPQKKSLVSIPKLAPIAVSLLVIGLCLFLFFPSVLQGNDISINAGTNTKEIVTPIDKDFTALFTIKDEENRVPINLLLTYRKDKKKMKVLSLPRDTYVPILNKQDGTTTYSKLTHAYLYGAGGAENVKTTVSNLLDVPIDYHGVMDLTTFSTMIDEVDGIDYDLKEDIQVRAISSVSFDFKKGTNHLNGEEILALIMAATVGKLGVEDQLNLINSVMDKVQSELPQGKLNEFTSKMEGNMPSEHWIDHKGQVHSFQSVSLLEGMKDDMIDGAYYITFEKDYLQAISEELTTYK